MHNEIDRIYKDRISYHFDGHLQTSINRFCPVNTCKRALSKKGENFEILKMKEITINLRKQYISQNRSTVKPKQFLDLFNEGKMLDTSIRCSSAEGDILVSFLSLHLLVRLLKKYLTTLSNIFPDGSVMLLAVASLLHCE